MSSGSRRSSHATVSARSNTSSPISWWYVPSESTALVGGLGDPGSQDVRPGRLPVRPVVQRVELDVGKIEGAREPLGEPRLAGCRWGR